MKIALVSTPRSGNTWLRMMVARAYGLYSTAVHDPYALDWQALPARSIVQVHWAPEAAFIERIESAGFQVLTIARHPLDVLISILHFCGHEPETRQWLLGEAGNESDIAFSSPTEPQFAAYACGARANALLQVSAQWWVRQQPIMKVKYEALVADPVAALQALEPALGPPLACLAEVVEAHTLNTLALASHNQHFWRGRPGLWKHLIEPSLARAVAAAHLSVFKRLGYELGSLDEIALSELKQNWLAMA